MSCFIRTKDKKEEEIILANDQKIKYEGIRIETTLIETKIDVSNSLIDEVKIRKGNYKGSFEKLYQQKFILNKEYTMAMIYLSNKHSIKIWYIAEECKDFVFELFNTRP